MTSEQTSDPFCVKDKTFLVTGGSGFICAELLQLLLDSGAKVASFDVKPQSKISESERFRHFVGEATSADQVHLLVADIKTFLGSIDCLVNGIGINIRGSVEGLSVENFEKVMDINLLSTVHFSREFAALPHDGDRAIVNFGSIAGLHGVAGDSAYCASKAAVMSFTKVCALEFAAKRIRVNSVAPSALKSPMMEALINDPVKGPELLKRFPLGRFGEPSDITGPVVFLCGSAAKWITGQTIVIDGGRSATT